MKLNDIIQGLDIINVKGELNIDINNVQYDSRKVTKGTLFICIKGFVSDGHKYIKDAIEKGASAFLVEEDVEIKGCTFIKVKDTRKDMAKVADNFYNHPSQKFNVIGVTGTNGKTSITTILNEILTLNKNKVGLIGTIKIFDGEKDIVSNSTTPESIDLQYHFNNMLDNGCDYCAMEVSSHSLALNRVDETDFKLGIFTNLTPDHLDFHKDLEDYRKAKEKLFFKTTMANIINIDDEGGKKIYENIKGINVPCYTYGVDTNADFMARDIKSDSDGVSYRLITPSYEEVIFIPVPGMFTVYNTLAVIAACYVLGIPKPIYKEGLRLSNGVSGRFETVPNDKGISVIVDYAHTPDALENVLKTTQQFAEGKIISVFGCGGDRDTEKRPLMGAIGQKYSDLCIITSDNPRTEEPEAIIKDILEGIDKKKENYHVVVDREQAISEAISMAKKDDVVIITGKGHETYQIIGKVKHHFDDKEVANECLSKM
ncbi:UDP-N-acetylmuramoyl-L-alanyl-D-glutamate--2,6-diaminopimelate ligase [Clostridioides difficile]|uniref:UDP-N-acetylmuramoyl-L-alanyl-D-glutamate--2,6-diaminopimelate ligase n=2 Tax=Clostridioides difficile TaxID=1496 RepID=A0AAX3GYG9_CLODI|nr:UDP-N-acetylmuramoyl-L-alanyl-D-glutamate--2,6-diaminopimelate ligase [Clostridioides difficile]AVD37509.1 UDP-N-acetylmuramoyl-L-alanyl-D-glutamate--2,6-diaminopimelate ligase [Clostridioides difficile]AVD39039.1 UDP-N-acetylmuramoyl-L-alanyl-D-glutamate--2,6-diaminopimelate ligase [Clostridioides difficile]AVD42564.1 UDP-N-acetylmuramoyl-L-alanyl-D-glutamate--2,6-diaminopimelate ligase [Clostridioides difficile]AXU69117.1 UDP-N-acetylmuramoylalanyl-D-glutamate--2, 6-diaminopimelate ligase 